MGEQNTRKLNQLERLLPEGLLVDAAWLERNGYYGSLRKKYVDLGWLEQPTHRVYRRPRGRVRWQQAVISLQTLLEVPVIVGGRSALDLQGQAHYLSQQVVEIHLYGPKAPPSWLSDLPLNEQFVFHKSDRLFQNEPVTLGLTNLEWDLDKQESRGINDPIRAGFTTVRTWGQWDWPLALSTLERAILELLDELPEKESFYLVDKIIEGLVNLSPRRLQKLLEDCKSVKVKRLFFYFAKRHDHAWLKRLDQSRVNLGKGKRVIFPGGKLDTDYAITVPRDLDAF